jgi:hypothetical protein
MATALIELDVGNTITVTIGGTTRILDVKADTDSGDLDEDMAAVAGLIGWYTQVLAAAREHSDLCSARYRSWQSQTLREFLMDDPRLAEWKAKAALNAEPAFMDHKTEQATAWKLVNRLSGAVKALEVKADMLRSRGAMFRTEVTHLDRGAPTPAEEKETIDAKNERLRLRLRGSDTWMG